MKLRDILLAVASLLLLAWPAKIMLLGEPWTWIAVANGVGGMVCLTIATRAWHLRGSG
jgi:hypothetical protein